MRANDAGYKIQILTTGQKLPGAQNQLHILYVADGVCTVRTGEKKTTLEKADMLLLMPGEAAALEVPEGSFAALLSMDYFSLCGALGKAQVRLKLNSREDTGQKYTQIRTLLQNLLLAHVGAEPGAVYGERGHFYLFLQALTDHFTLPPEENASTVDSRAARMLGYIHLNYRADVSLGEIAQALYLSESSASRLFRRTTGETFPAYVKKLRLAQVKAELAETDRSVTEIATETGFSTPSALNKAFKDAFGVTPGEYRAAHRQTAVPAEPNHTGREQILHILQKDRAAALTGAEAQSVLRADTARQLPWRKWENKVLNVGPLHVLRLANMQKQVLYLKRHLNVEYLRVWNPFARQLMICGEQPGEYNFSFLDEILDFCVDNGLKLFIDLAQRKDIALASENQEIYSSGASTEFASREDWEQAMSALLSHLRQRYPEPVTAGWIFELTFFLNDKPYYTAPDYDRSTVWRQGTALIRRHLPLASIAGPGLVDNADPAQTEKAIREFLSAGSPPDIFTAIHYPYAVTGTMETGAIYQNPYQKIAGRTFLDERMTLTRSVLQKNGFAGQYWVTEWGNSLANRNYVQDSCFRAAFIVENVLRNQGRAGTMGIFYASDLLGAYSDSDSVLSGSAGLLSRSGIRKPAYFAYKFLDSLGRNLIAQTENCIVTCENGGDIRILCCNNKALGPRYYLTEENAYRPEELGRLFVNTDPQYMELILTFPEDSRTYRVRQQVLNEKTGDVLSRWIAFGCTSDLTRDDLEYLEQTSVPAITLEQMTSRNGQLQLSFAMEPNEVRLITVTGGGSGR